MDLLIIPFLGDFEIPQDTTEAIIESKDDLTSILNKEIKKGIAYHIQAYRNEPDHLYVVFDSKEVTTYIKYDDKEKKMCSLKIIMSLLFP